MQRKEDDFSIILEAIQTQPNDTFTMEDLITDIGSSVTITVVRRLIEKFKQVGWVEYQKRGTRFTPAIYKKGNNILLITKKDFFSSNNLREHYVFIKSILNKTPKLISKQEFFLLCSRHNIPYYEINTILDRLINEGVFKKASNGRLTNILSNTPALTITNKEPKPEPVEEIEMKKSEPEPEPEFDDYRKVSEAESNSQLEKMEMDKAGMCIFSYMKKLDSYLEKIEKKNSDLILKIKELKEENEEQAKFIQGVDDKLSKIKTNDRLEGTILRLKTANDKLENKVSNLNDQLALLKKSASKTVLNSLSELKYHRKRFQQ